MWNLSWTPPVQSREGQVQGGDLAQVYNFRIGNAHEPSAPQAFLQLVQPLAEQVFRSERGSISARLHMSPENDHLSRYRGQALLSELV